MRRRRTFIFSCLCFGYAFLYIPILAMIAWSFNDSRLMSVWTGFSLRWYQALWQNEQIIDAALLSLRIAFVSATFATLLGTLAALAMSRLGRFRGRTAFSGMLAAPLVMPEVITGLSLLMLFVSLQGLLGWPAKRGADTIAIAHITFAMAYVAVVVQARLTAIDRSLEEAAMDLGGRPMGVTLDITLPLIAPAMLSRLAAGLHPLLGRSGHRQLRFRAGVEHLADGDLLQSQTGHRAGRERLGDGHCQHRWAGGAGGGVADAAHRPPTHDRCALAWPAQTPSTTAPQCAGETLKQGPRLG